MDARSSQFEKALAELFAKLRPPPILVGGWALNAYGISRQTVDADVMIAESAFEAARRSLIENGYELGMKTDLFARFRCGVSGQVDIDLLFASVETVAAMFKAGRQCDLGFGQVTVPSLLHLIGMKLHALRHNFAGRAGKDLPDIVALMQAAGWTARSPEFVALCGKYGSVDVLERIRAVVGEEPR
jgi:hypothetical protein